MKSRPRSIVILSLIGMILSLMIIAPSENQQAAAGEGVYQEIFVSGNTYLTVEILDDDLAHFEYGAGTFDSESIWTTPMVAKTDYTGPTTISFPSENVIETGGMRLDIDPDTLCITATDLNANLRLTTMCPQIDAEAEDSVILSFTPEGVMDVYGLGEHFQRRGGAIGNWYGQRRLMLNPYGNELARFEGGNVGNAQFPIIYALGDGTDNYALFVDHVYWQVWNFASDPFSMQTNHAPLRWYLMAGDDLPDLRHDYMELTGHPPVPPKQMFGLWVSEYGYESWDELLTDLESLRAANFPLDGFVLDLQWFGGISPSDSSQMGSLSWDLGNFPDPVAMITMLRETYGLGIMTIEEPYVAESAEGYVDAAQHGVLVRECGETDCPLIEMNSWWGIGGMVDWTNPDAAAWWHDQRRQPLIDDGVIGHWTDLGEPENFDDRAWYFGFPEFDRHSQSDVHNVYNFFWSESIFEGYQRNEVERRPFILSRSGTSGSQRFGVAMWSGDIAANMTSLATHMNAQMHMSLSGVDYFGSDIGGFYRNVRDPLLDPDTMYTIWLANSVLLDVPLRPHAFNLQNDFDTVPALIGDIDSNLANVRLRYTLSPYLYTLAHRAYRDGDPVFAPLVYYFQDDPNVRELGSQKMIGPDVLMATISGYETETISVYLPAGGWFNFHTNDYIQSSGEWVDVSTNVDGILRTPLFVREGAIIPMMPVDENTLNMLGQQVDGGIQNDLIINVYAADDVQSFTLIEDDGETIAYQDGIVRETEILAGRDESGWLIEINPVNSTYQMHSPNRSIQVNIIGEAESITTATMSEADMNAPLQITLNDD